MLSHIELSDIPHNLQHRNLLYYIQINWENENKFNDFTHMVMSSGILLQSINNVDGLFVKFLIKFIT